ncbi:DUF3899 domain-containing protein [Bacillaceae bacterium S4-13-58]
MKFLTNKWWLLMLNLVVGTLFFLISSTPKQLSTLINILFYLSSAYLFMGIALFVIKGQFFDGVIFGFRRFFFRISKSRDLLDEWEPKPPISEKVNQTFLYVVFFQGVMLLLIMFVALFVFYQF